MGKVRSTAAVPPSPPDWAPPVGEPAGMVIYFWGISVSQNREISEQGHTTQEVRWQAAQSGWDETQPEAWAREIFLPVCLEEALAVVETLLGADGTAIGWKLRPIRGR